MVLGADFKSVARESESCSIQPGRRSATVLSRHAQSADICMRGLVSVNVQRPFCTSSWFKPRVTVALCMIFLQCSPEIVQESSQIADMQMPDRHESLHLSRTSKASWVSSCVHFQAVVHVTMSADVLQSMNAQFQAC